MFRPFMIKDNKKKEIVFPSRMVGLDDNKNLQEKVDEIASLLGEVRDFANSIRPHYRERNKIYAIGDIVYSGKISPKYYLLCNIGGTTTNSDIVIPSTISEGVTFQDGTVNWIIKSFESNENTSISTEEPAPTDNSSGGDFRSSPSGGSTGSSDPVPTDDDSGSNTEPTPTDSGSGGSSSSGSGSGSDNGSGDSGGKNVTPETPKKAVASLSVSSPDGISVEVGKIGTIVANTEGDGDIVADVADKNIATSLVEGKNITVISKSAGETTMSISQEEGENYQATEAITVPITVTEEKAFQVSSFNDTSWETISEIARAGKGASYFNLGDCKEITLNGKIGLYTFKDERVNVFILDFNHPMNGVPENNIILGGFKTLDGVDICLGDNDGRICSESGKKTYNINHWGNWGFGGWKGCDFRYDILGATSTPPSGYGSSPKSGRIGYDATEDTLAHPKADTLLAALSEDFRGALRLWTRWVDAQGFTQEEIDNGVQTKDIDYEKRIQPTVDAVTLLAESEIYTKDGGFFMQIDTGEVPYDSTLLRYSCKEEYNHNTQMAYYKNKNNKIRKYKYYNGVAEIPHSDSPNVVVFPEHGEVWYTCSTSAGNARGFSTVDVRGNLTGFSVFGSYGLAPAFKI